ncbi:MAG: hypothetical protein ACTSWY_07025 [Promethearchaeota archaeon]
MILFKEPENIHEIEEEEGDYSVEESESDGEIKMTLEELKTAVGVMKDLLHSALKSDKDKEIDLKLPAEIFTDHIKISWDSRYTENIKRDVAEFVKIQGRLQEINRKFVELKISKYRYELLKDILSSKVSYKLQKIMKSVY